MIILRKAYTCLLKRQSVFGEFYGSVVMFMCAVLLFISLEHILLHIYGSVIMIITHGKVFNILIFLNNLIDKLKWCLFSKSYLLRY